MKYPITILDFPEFYKELAYPSCEVKIYDLNKTKIPTVVVDGKVCSCCDNNVINKKDLQAAGAGQPL